MKISLATTTPEVTKTVPVSLLDGTFDERIARAAELGYNGVELMVVRPQELDPEFIRNVVDRNGLEISAIASGAVYMVDGLTLLAGEAGQRRKALERLVSLVKFAGAVKAPLVTIGGFRGRAVWVSEGDARGILSVALRVASEAAADEKVRIVLEPLNRYETDLFVNLRQTLGFLDAIDLKNVGVLLDVFHMNIEEPLIEDSLQAAIQAGKLWHVHIGDSNRLPPGQGHLDFPKILQTLKELGYPGYISAELLALPDPDSAAQATIRYIRSMEG
jgi:sugar phosphate isomerase/epimerase